jgi:hypothetical protein
MLGAVENRNAEPAAMATCEDADCAQVAVYRKRPR